MKTTTLIIALAISSSILLANGSHDGGHEIKMNDHMGNHMHEGKMTNHMNVNGMPDKNMKKKMNDHMGDHIHEGKMTNHMKM